MRAAARLGSERRANRPDPLTAIYNFFVQNFQGVVTVKWCIINYQTNSLFSMFAEWIMDAI